jgi:hypothetical protein
MPATRHRRANSFRLDQPLEGGRPQADAPLPERVQSDLTADAPVGEAELVAIERLLGENLAAFLAALH